MANNFKVGKTVRIIGDTSDFTDHIDGKLGVIQEVRDRDCYVKLNNDGGCWYIWHRNLVIVD